MPYSGCNACVCATKVLSGALVGLPWLRTVRQVDCFAVVMGVAGGFVLVIFFSFWARTSGRAPLGRIQGTAQRMTAPASVVGPWLLAECHARTGFCAAVFYIIAAVVVGLRMARGLCQCSDQPGWRVRPRFRALVDRTRASRSHE